MARNAMYINKKTGPKSRVEVRAEYETLTHTVGEITNNLLNYQIK